jgi:hypothetical protein
VGLACLISLMSINFLYNNISTLLRILVVFQQHLISCKLCLYNNVNIYCTRSKEKESQKNEEENKKNEEGR